MALSCVYASTSRVFFFFVHLLACSGAHASSRQQMWSGGRACGRKGSGPELGSPVSVCFSGDVCQNENQCFRGDVLYSV